MNLPDIIALGTMHRKEEVIAPPLARLGITLVVPADLDTDRFGTFTGERPRTGTMLEAARAKARAAADAKGLPVGLASEGAYGPHPAIPFMPIGRELLLWRNELTGHEIVEMIIDEAPCFDQVTASSMSDVEAFLDRIEFPETAVIVSPVGHGIAPLAKGVQDRPTVAEAIERAVRESPEDRAVIQSDMRAHMNRHRMGVIARLSERFAARLATPCPSCSAPGFGIARSEAGLPCGDCGAETQLTRSVILSCGACHFERRAPRPDGRMHAGPAECPECNP
jgi:hypothetical protein